MRVGVRGWKLSDGTRYYVGVEYFAFNPAERTGKAAAVVMFCACNQVEILDLVL